MLWAQIAPVLVSAVTQAALEPNTTTGPNYSALWQNQERPFADTQVQAEIFLSIGKSTRIDWGYTDTFNATTNKIDRSIKSQHEFTLSVQVRSYEQIEANWAFEYAERIRTRIDREDIYETLLSANVVVIEDLGIVAADAAIDGRQCSVANLDLRLRCAFDDATFPLDWIEQVQLSGAVSGGKNPITFPAAVIQ
jgi:hypothetical protein